MRFWILTVLSFALLGCLPRPAAVHSKTEATVSVCYKDFFGTLEGKRLNEAMRAANEERSGQSMSSFGLNQIRNYLEPLYHTKASDRGLGSLRPRWALFNVFSFYGYAPPWVKWGLPDTLKVTAKKIEKVYEHIQLVDEIGKQQRTFTNAEGVYLDLAGHVSYLKDRLAVIVEKRDKIVRTIKDNPEALADSAVSKAIQIANTNIEDEFVALEWAISRTKTSFDKYWDRVEKLHVERESELTRNSQELVGRLDADEEFLLAVSRFITSPADTLIRGDTLTPLSRARPQEQMIRGADGTPLEFRSYVFVEGTRESVFDALHDRGIHMIVFLDGADGVERQMIFMSQDSGLADAANKSTSSLKLTQQELSILQKWRPDELMVARSSNAKTLTVLKLDEVAPDKFGPLARGVKQGDECPICINDLPLAGDTSSAGGITFCPNCCKGFHPQCMLGWARSRPNFSCPMCRGELSLDSLIK